MSKIDKLIQELCPDGVVYRQLGDIEDSKMIKLGRGSVISKKDIVAEPGNYPIYSSSASGVGEFGRYGKYMFDDERLSWSVDGGGRFFYRQAHKYSVTNVSGWLKVLDCSLINIKYLYYALDSAWRTKKFDYTKKAHPSVIRVEYKIPVPPIEVQKEIVKILDTFTQLEAELEAELEARRKQYEFYRNQLLTFNDEGKEKVRWQILESVTVSTGNVKWDKITNSTYKYIDLSSVSRDDHTIVDTVEIGPTTAPSRARKIIATNDIIFATTRPTLKRYTYINQEYDGQIASTGFCVLRADTDKVIPGWILHNIGSSEFNDYVERNQEGSAYPAISDSKVKQFKIPVPPLDEQERIVSILDKFDKLVNDISEGLPAELNARRKQYEYYRTKLLTFQEAKE